MSLDTALGRVCYVHCNFCNTVLAVSVPSTILSSVVTIRCGHCANLLSLDVGALQHTVHLQHLQKQTSLYLDSSKDYGSSSASSRYSSKSDAGLGSSDLNKDQARISSTAEKKQRVPSAYNKFIKEEIQRIKANNPSITHREAFSTAAKNWAHFPRIQFGLTLKGTSQVGEAYSGHQGSMRQGFH